MWRHSHIAAGLLAAACAAAVGGCAGSSGGGVMFFAEPGRYQYHTCEQLTAAVKTLETRQKDLGLLIDAARQTTVGAAVGLVTYQAEYRSNQEDFASIEGVARTKKCTTAENWRSNAVIR